MNREEYLMEQMGVLYTLIHGKHPNKEQMQNVLTTIENMYFELSKRVDYNIDEKEPMIEAIETQTKERLLMLENKQRMKDSFTFIQEQTKVIADKIRRFWKEEGFYYLANVKVERSGIVEVEFGFELAFNSMFTNKKVSAKKEKEERIHKLIEEGYVLDEKQKQLLDRPINKEKVEQLIKKRFPSSYITTWQTNSFHKKDQKLYRLWIKIPDVSDI